MPVSYRLRRFGRVVCVLALASTGLAFGCDKPEAPKPVAEEPAAEELKPAAAETEQPKAAAAMAAVADTLPKGLLLAYAQFEMKDGKALANPQAARLEILTRQDGAWKVQVLEDPDSNVFHKAMMYTAKDGTQSLVTLGGMQAVVKSWIPKGDGFTAETLWAEKFGGKWDRMRDGEIGDVYGDGQPTLVIATHDQGVVAALHPDGKGKFEVKRLGARPDTFVHEIELGDLNGDGVIEAYATPSEPNKLTGGEQAGLVWRFVPKEGKGPEVAADLGKRHAKEILVRDVDGDGRDELYVAVEALTEGTGDSLRLVEPVAIQRYDADTPADKGQVVATLPDRFCRFLPRATWTAMARRSWWRRPTAAACGCCARPRKRAANGR